MSKELEIIKEKIVPILREHKVTKAGIFGSYVRGEQKKKSDVDILVEIDKDFDLIDLIRLKNTLERAIKKKVDLVEYGCIRKELRKNILEEEVPLIL